jgi:hypothetical protein
METFIGETLKVRLVNLVKPINGAKRFLFWFVILFTAHT